MVLELFSENKQLDKIWDPYIYYPMSKEDAILSGLWRMDSPWKEMTVE